jgi:methenyltetrahydrofolate cyclohydrolase
MLSEMTIKEFLAHVASADAVPGGGSVAALSAALTAALTGMVAGLTVGRAGDEALDEHMNTVISRALELQTLLTADIDRDSAAYGDVMKAYRMPKGTDDEKGARSEAIQNALAHAARVPLAVAEAGVELLELSKKVVAEGNPNAVTDGAVGALLARSAVIGALLNVRINLASLKDKAAKAAMMERTYTLENDALKLEEEVLALARLILEKET